MDQLAEISAALDRIEARLDAMEKQMGDGVPIAWRQAIMHAVMEVARILPWL